MEVVPTTEVATVAKMGWKMPWGIEPSHLASLGPGDIIVLLLILFVTVLLTVWLVDKLRCRDKISEGWYDGYYAGLRSKAKMRYHHDLGVIVATVPEEEYNKELDDITAATYH